MARPKSNRHRYNFLIDRDVYKDFSLLCEELGLVRGKKLEISMKKFIEENKELLKKLKGKKSGGGRK
jgi:hypothetical protein